MSFVQGHGAALCIGVHELTVHGGLIPDRRAGAQGDRDNDSGSGQHRHVRWTFLATSARTATPALSCPAPWRGCLAASVWDRQRRHGVGLPGPCEGVAGVAMRGWPKDLLKNAAITQRNESIANREHLVNHLPLPPPERNSKDLCAILRSGAIGKTRTARTSASRRALKAVSGSKGRSGRPAQWAAGDARNGRPSTVNLPGKP